MDRRISVLIVDHDSMFRRGLIGCLAAQPEIRIADVVGMAADGLRRVIAMRPDVVLAGSSLPDAANLEMVVELRQRLPALALVVLAHANNDTEFIAAVRAGASGYVSRDMAEEHVISLVRRVAAGDAVIAEQLRARPAAVGTVLKRLRRHVDRPPARPPVCPLTGRELDILQQVAAGRTNGEIAEIFGISPHTVKNHLAMIMRKLAVSDRTQAVLLTVRRGWIPLHVVLLDEATPNLRGGSLRDGGVE